MSEQQGPPSRGNESSSGPAPEDRLEAVYSLLEDGEVMEALEQAQSLESEHPDDGEAALAHAAAAHEAGFARETLAAAERAGTLETSEPALQQYYVSASLYRLWEFDGARTAAEETLRREAEFGDAWYLLAQICEMQADEIGARRGYGRAFEVDPERFPRPARISDEAMEESIASAAEELPPEFRSALDEVPVVCQPLVAWEMVAPDSEFEDPFPPDILGLFVGGSRLDQSVFNPTEQPGIIFLFQKNLERICADLPSLEEEVRVTLWHELAHYLGFEEEDMEEMGLE